MRSPWMNSAAARRPTDLRALVVSATALGFLLAVLGVVLLSTRPRASSGTAAKIVPASDASTPSTPDNPLTSHSEAAELAPVGGRAATDLSDPFAQGPAATRLLETAPAADATTAQAVDASRSTRVTSAAKTEPPSPPPQPQTEPISPTAISAAAQPLGEFFALQPRLSRWLLLTSESCSPLEVCAFLHDPDSVLRRMAVAAAAERMTSTPGGDSVSRDPVPSDGLVDRAGENSADDLAVLLRLCVDPAVGRELPTSLQSLVTRHGNSRRLDVETADAVVHRALSRLERSFGRLRRESTLDAWLRQGGAMAADVALLLDVSKSMGPHLPALRSQLSWLWPALEWGGVDVRLGILAYRDSVVGEFCFDLAPRQQLEGLEAFSAEGGGDVPEGVHVALRAALSLRLCPWREDTVGVAKNVVVVGDAPPPYIQQTPLVRVVEAARQQAGFRVHALGLEPEPEQRSLAFFTALASAGGGRSVVLPAADAFSRELLRCLWPAAPQQELEEFLKALKAVESVLATLHPNGR